MEPAAYTLIGALGGVIITQIANFLLEEKRITHRREDEAIAREKVARENLQARRQEAYALFMAEFDFYIGVNHSRADQMLKYFYSATIIASEAISDELPKLLNLAQETGDNGEELKVEKGKVVKIMRTELTSANEI